MSAAFALLCIDLQVGFVDGGTPLYRREQLLDTISGLQRRARACGVPVVHVRFDGGVGHPTETGTPGWAFHERVAPMPGEQIVTKRNCDSFFQTELKAVLDASAIRAFSVVGCITEMCIDGTARTGASLGFDVSVVSDAHSTPDASLPDGPTPQMRIQWFNHVMARIAGPGLNLAVRDSSSIALAWEGERGNGLAAVA